MTKNGTTRSLFELTGKVALVTGASKGIGETIAHALAEYGASVVVSSRRQEAVDSVAQQIQSRGFEAAAIAANMGRMEQVEALVDNVVSEYGALDIIVNNAATNPVYGSIDQTDSGAFDKIIDVNLKGPLMLCNKAYPILKARGGGSIIHLSSIGGLTPEKGIGMYSVSKAALINLTKAMAQDWGKDNIRINAICPGLIKTKFSEALWRDDQNRERFLSKIPMGRLGETQDLAGLAVFLASEASAYCTGGFYMVDGGYAAA